MSLLKEMIFDNNNDAEKSILAFLGFGAAVWFGLTDKEGTAEAFLFFSAACLGINAIGGAIANKKATT